MFPQKMPKLCESLKVKLGWIPALSISYENLCWRYEHQSEQIRDVLFYYR